MFCDKEIKLCYNLFQRFIMELNMNNSDITQKQKKTYKIRYILVTVFILLLITVGLVFSLFQHQPKPNPMNDKIILEAAAEMLKMDSNYFVENDYFHLIYELNLTKLPFDINLNKGYPRIVYVRRGSVNMPIWGLVEISDIQYIEKFFNLESVYLKICFPQKDIPKWMVNLSKLGILNLNKRFSIDLKPLAKLHNLKIINLSGSHIQDIKPLEVLDKLESLMIGYTYVYNIKPISKLNNLKTLDISSTEVSNFEPIGELTNLQKLFLSNTKVSNLEFLKKLKHLYKLEIKNCPNITDDQIEDLQKALPELEIAK